jgi:nucleotide-binding universal stress UspA family protein
VTQDALYPTVIVPMDFSPASRLALELAADLCEQGVCGRIVLVHGNYIPVELAEFAAGELTTHLSERAAELLAEQLTGLSDRGIAAEYFALQGAPSEVIIETANEHHADLVVMGTHGHTGVAHALLGSVAERVVQRAPCPVLTVKAADAD